MSHAFWGISPVFSQVAAVGSVRADGDLRPKHHGMSVQAFTDPAGRLIWVDLGLGRTAGSHTT
ncbi:hypothetical protein [Streptomyces clavifer]|uniref:hypothetical protein n=1 Tax=Streptomyces clavifer TaxID=68188 RepID=UPI00364E19F9